MQGIYFKEPVKLYTGTAETKKQKIVLKHASKITLKGKASGSKRQSRAMRPIWIT